MQFGRGDLAKHKGTAFFPLWRQRGLVILPFDPKEGRVKHDPTLHDTHGIEVLSW